jgi:hypothetical protein
MDSIYENMVRQIARGALPWHDGDDLKEAVQRGLAWGKIDHQIAVLQAKMHNERQFNRQVELHGEIRRLILEKGEG